MVKSSATLSQQASAAETTVAAAAVVTPDVAAKLALYEEKIQELMHLVEEQGHQSDRETELEARLKVCLVVQLPLPLCSRVADG